MSNESSWTPFWMETNAAFGQVRSRADWVRLICRFSEGRSCTLEEGHALFMRTARLATYLHSSTALDAGGLPSIGTRREHMDGAPFAAWANEQGIDVSLPDEREISEVPL